MKRIVSCLCAVALAVGISACGGQTKPIDTTCADAVLTGQVREITENTVTLQLGELTSQKPDDTKRHENGGQQPPDPPQNGEAAPGSGSPPEGAPEKPESERPADLGETGPGREDAAPPAVPEDAPFEMGGGLTTFAAGEETVTLPVSDEALEALASLEPGDVVQVETDENGVIRTISIIDLEPGIGGGAGGLEQGSAAYILAVDGDYGSETYPSVGDDENALRVDGAAVTLTDITVEKTAGASSDAESGDFYGMNAALLATGGAQVTIRNARVPSSARNGNGVFSYGEGTVVNISDSVIETSGDNSGGLQTTGGGTTNAADLTVTTQGNSSAAIRSDRGGGTVHVDGGTYTSGGLNSPAVYSTADITVKNAVLTAGDSEALVIEGRNSIALVDCDVSGAMNDTKSSSADINVHNVMIYQSMSGDAAAGTSAFAMTGGTLTGNSGDMFFVTNTGAVIELTGVKLANNDPEGALLRVTGNSASRGWGAAGANGARVTFTAKAQVLEGDIVVDTISALELTLADSSSFTGTIRIEDNAEGGAAVEDNAVVIIQEGSSWTLTGDCIITSLDNRGTIDYNGHTITLADGTVLRGETI